MKTNKKVIIYIGNFELPDKNAAAQRVISNGKIPPVFVTIDCTFAEP